MIANVDVEILASGWRWGRGRLEDLGTALGRGGQTCARVEADGEIDVVASYKAAAVGEEEE